VVVMIAPVLVVYLALQQFIREGVRLHDLVRR
jgi:ABC-type glycerol-3-phosphate transport system permease component